MRLKRKPDKMAFPVGIYPFEGDQAKALQWLPWARNQLKDLLKEAKGKVRFKALEPEADVKVELTTSTNTAFIRIVAGALAYLDSGYYNHQSIAPLHQDAFLPSVVKYGSEQLGGLVQGSMKIVDGYADGETLADGRQSKPMGAKNPLIRTAYNGYVSADDIYADDPTLLRRKRIQATLKPSNWQGLTRLWVQCMYGSMTGQGRYDIPAMADDGSMIGGQAPVLSVKYKIGDQDAWLPLPHTGIQAPWLLVNPDHWIYWLVTVNANGTARFRKLATTLSMPKQAGLYTGLQARQAHAALLAGAKLTNTVIDVAINVTPVGDTLGYGWAADATGNSAKIVGHALVDTPPSRFSRAYSATVTFDATGKPNGLTLTLQQAAWDINSTAHCLYIPMELAGVRYQQAQPNVQYFGGFDCNAPIMARSVAPNYTPEFINIVGTSGNGTVGFSGAGISEAGIVNGPYNTPLPWTVSSGGETDMPTNGNGIPDDDQEFFFYPETWITLENFNIPKVSDTRTSQPSGDGQWEERIINVTQVFWTGHWHYETGVREFCRPLLLIPFDDAESVVSGNETGRTFESVNDTITQYYFPKRVEFQHRFMQIGQTEVPPWESWGVVTYQDADVSGSWADNDTGQLQFYPVNGGTGVGGAGSESTHSMRVQVKGAAVAVSNPAHVYFEPSIGPSGNPLINASTVETSMGDSYRYALSQGESGASDWPEGTSNAAGWA